jgi:hypothetical protein
MDCKTARLLLPFAGRELDAAEADALQAHLTDCPDCAAAAEAERALDERLGRAVRDVPVPDGPRANLLRKLRGERDAFYRRWAFRAAGIAAALALAVGLGWFGWLKSLPEVDVDGISKHVAEQYQSPPDRVTEWLKRVGGNRHFVAPPDTQFNYHLLAARGVDEVEGKQVPFLFFVGDDRGTPVWARVYVLGDRRFNLTKLQEQAGAGGSGAGGLQAAVLPGPTDRIVYVVIYNGVSLAPFRPPPGKIVSGAQPGVTSLS